MSPRVGLLVVGSGPAGLEAVRAYRDAGGDRSLTMVTDDAHPPYDRPPLSKDFLRGESTGEDLPLEDPSFYDDLGVDLRLGTGVVAVDTARREARLADGTTLGFDVCVLATGAAPSAPPVAGVDHPDVLLLRSRSSAETLLDRAGSASTAVVVGSGFIGCEAAASLALRGLDVTVVTQETRPQVDRLGPDAAARISGWLTDLGVRLVTGQQVASFEDGRVVALPDGERVAADLVLVAGGVSPRSHLAEEAGAQVEQGRVVVDDAMRTDRPGLLAAGDVVLARNRAAGRRIAVEHWGDAVRMGEVAGHTAAGVDDAWAQVPGFWSQIGDRTLKYAAWGDGWDDARFESVGGRGFAVWYAHHGRLVGVLTHEADEHYERGSDLVERSDPLR